jgi:hypothetical protein
MSNSFQEPSLGGISDAVESSPASGEAGRPSVHKRTQLVDSDQSQFQDFGWKFTFWPECAEASVSIVTSGSNRRRGTERDREKSDDELTLLWQIANGRAGTRSRRYFVTNRLRYMWVLTFAQSRTDRSEVMAEVSEFARRLRIHHGGDSYPYWYSPELHPLGHGWHVNFFIAFRATHADIEALWGHGFVWVTDFATSMRGPKGEPLGLCRTPREGLRRASNYGCKYAQKDWSPENVGALNHRYEVAQGFAAVCESCWVNGPGEAELLVQSRISDDERRWMKRWNSDDEPDWTRPPVWTWRW